MEYCRVGVLVVQEADQNIHLVAVIRHHGPRHTLLGGNPQKPGHGEFTAAISSIHGNVQRHADAAVEVNACAAKWLLEGLKPVPGRAHVFTMLAILNDLTKDEKIRRNSGLF